MMGDVKAFEIVQRIGKFEAGADLSGYPRSRFRDLRIRLRLTETNKYLAHGVELSGKEHDDSCNRSETA